MDTCRNLARELVFFGAAAVVAIVRDVVDDTAREMG